MNCDRCEEQEATTHVRISNPVDGVKYATLHLCRDCHAVVYRSAKANHQAADLDLDITINRPAEGASQ